MKYKLRIRLIAAFVTVVGALLSCSEDPTEPFQLYYADVVDMGQSMSFSTAQPSSVGGTASDYRIYAVTQNDQPVDFQESFSVDPALGVVTITRTEDLQVGIYKISISCVVNGSTYSFKDVLSVEILPSVPSEIEVVPAVVDIDYGAVPGEKPDSAVVRIISSSCSVQTYALEQEKGKEYFAISNRGVIRRNAQFEGDIPPGVYPLSVKLTTKAGQRIYEEAVTFNITSAPLELTYTPNAGKMEVNNLFQSAIPVLKGSADELVYSIKGVEPTTSEIAIDAHTGQLSVAADNGLPVGTTYTISVHAENKYGAKDFDDIYTLTVIDFITPISEFSYPAASKIESSAWSVSPDASFKGDQVTFSFVDLPEALNGKLTLSSTTGAISTEKGNTIAVGTYAVKVKAENVKNSVEAVFDLTIEANPNRFTKIVYGNNLGLDPETHANQFCFMSADEQRAYGPLVPTTDIPAGKDVKWSIDGNYLGTVGSTIKIDSQTGAVTVSYYKNNATESSILFFVVRATVGEGTDAEFSKTVPVFICYPLTFDGVVLKYKPFVFQVNPATGGTSDAPIFENLGGDEKIVSLYRRSFRFFNMNGPSSHGDYLTGKQPSDNGLLNTLWRKYYEAIGKQLNTGAENPLVYQNNTMNPSVALGYVDLDNRVRINPNMWVDGDGNYANGFFLGQIVYLKYTTTEPALNDTRNSTNKTFPIIIWFDTNF